MAFIDKISEYITTHYDLTKENLTIVFPNKRAALRLRNKLAQSIKTNFWVPQIVSIQQAMEEWSGLQLVDKIDVIFEIIKMNENFFSYAAQMAKDFDEIDQYGVDAEKLFDHLKSAKEIEEWNLTQDSVESKYLEFFSSLIHHYNNLRDNLEKNGMGYYGLITRKIASYDDETLAKRTKGRKIIFAGFNALTKTEENIIVRLVESGNAVILWDLDNYYLQDERQEAGLFARRFFKTHPNIEKNFIGDSFTTQEKEINIISASGNAVQTNALQLMLKNQPSHNESEVIVLADESLLIPVLNSIPDTRDDIQVTMGYPFANTVTYHFVEQLFKLQQSLTDDENKIYVWTFLRFCNADFIKLIFKGKDYDSLKAWLLDMANSSVYYFKSADLEYFKEHEALNRFLKLCIRKWSSSEDCIETIKTILTLAADKLKDDKNFIKNQISVAGRIVNRIELLRKKYGEYIKIVDIQTLYIQVAGQMSIDLKGDSNGLQIMGLLETRNLDFDVIHFLSVNEGVLPQNKSNNSLIPFDIRKAFNLPTYSHQQAVYAYHFYRLLQNAKEINLYYNNLADSSGTGMGEPSRFIQQIDYEYAKNNAKVTLKHYQYKSPTINDKQDDIIVEKTDSILNKIHSLSPTSISKYLRCPLKYYWSVIENIKDNSPEEEMPMNVIGNIIHGTLDHLYQKFGHDIITPQLYNAVCDKYLKDCYNEALKDNSFNNGLPDTGFNCLNKTVIDSMLNNFIKKEKEFVSGDNELSIIDTEKELNKEVEVGDYKVRLHGFADRIDKVNGTIRIIDYKTGKVNKTDVKIQSDHLHLSDMTDKSIQLMMYKYLFMHNNPDVDPDMIEPGIIGFQKLSNGIFQLNIADTHDLNKDFKKTCDEYFQAFLEELFDKNIPFKQTEDVKNCSICEFKNICKR